MAKDPLWGNRPVKEVKRALHKAIIVLPPSLSSSSTDREDSSGTGSSERKFDANEPLLREREREREKEMKDLGKSPPDILEYEEEEDSGTTGSRKY